jgi:S1-C subfamily serine protease
VGVRVGSGAASGVVVTADGYVATVAHNIQRPFERCTVFLPDGREVDGVTLGKWGSADCGLIKILDEGEYDFVPIGSSAALEQHQPVIATGHPGGPSRDVPAALRFGVVDRNGEQWVRSTCAIMPGDSGGGLFDLTGRLVGIGSRIQVDVRVNENVPIDRLVEGWDRLARGETWDLENRTRRRWRRGSSSEPAPELLAIAADPPPAPVEEQLLVTTEEPAAPAPPFAGRAEGELDDAAAELVGELFRSVVRLEGERDGGRRARVLAVAVAPGGVLLTKASELGERMVAQLPGGDEAAVELLASDADLDLALVRVAAELAPVAFDTGAELAPGRLLVSVGPSRRPAEVGVVSRPPERVPSIHPGYLGVRLEDGEGGGALLASVEDGTAAASAGLEAGDVVLALDGRNLANRASLVREVRRRDPGERVLLDVRRGDARLEIEAVLGVREGQDSRRGSHAADRVEVSRRRDRFQLALRHDSMLSPDECGGPVVDVFGRVVGLNLARADRTAAYLLPSEEVLSAIEQLSARAGLDEEPRTEERELVGWRVHVDRTLLEGEGAAEGAEVLAALESHLRQVALLVPADRLEKLRAVELQVDRDDPGLSGMQYHPSRGWLVEHGHAASLAKRVHVPQSRELLSRDLLAVQPRVVLHELAHAYHDQVLGFDDGRVRAAYEEAVDGGAYEDVLHVDGRRTRHYALTDAKEYFAEGTEAYFGANDFYPFVRAELREHDPGLFSLLEEVWGALP